MLKTSLILLRRALLGALLLCLLPAAAGAVQHEVRILLDLDDDTATGCEVTTVDGPFAGAEQVLITTVETSSPPDAGTITDVALAECVDEATDTFGIPTSFDGNWPVGVGNGVGGRDVVESYVPLLSLVIQEPSLVHLGLVVTDEQGGEEALLTTDDTPDGPAIVLDLRSVLEIPTLEEWGLILLALLLAAASIHLMGRRGTAAVGLVLLVLATGVAWAAGTLDGLTDDWSPGDQLAANGLVLFGKGAGPDLCFRVDLDLLFNQPPVAEDDAFNTDEGVPLSVPAPGVLGNDSDPEGGPLTSSLISPPANADSFTLNPDGSFDYTPASGFNGLDPFTYQAVDDAGAASNTATVNIAVGAVNNPPVAIGDSATTDEDVAVVIDVLANDSDSDGNLVPGSVTVTGGPSNGGTSVNAATGEITYTPAADFNGTDSFTYEVCDDGTPLPAECDTATVEVTVNPIDDPPVAVDDAATVTEDDPATAIDVLANDTDVDGGPISISGASDPSGGTVVITGGGSGLTYEPDPDFCNDGSPTDDFTYTLSPGGSTATVAVTVTCVDDPPVAVDDSATVTEDDPATPIDVLANDSDPEGDAFTIDSASDPAGGTVVITGGGTGLTYEPDPDFCNDGLPTDDFTYTLDPGGSTATVAVTVTCVNDPPVVTNATITYNAVGNTLLRVPGNDPDHDGGVPGRIASTSDPDDAFVKSGPSDIDSASVAFQAGTFATTQGGSLTIDDDGDFHYTPPTGVTGVTDDVTVQVEDTEGLTTPVTIEITLSEMVWYVEDTTDATKNPAAGPGTSRDAFETLGAAESASGPGDFIVVFETTGALDEGIALKSGQKLYGQPVEDLATPLLPGGLLLEPIADTDTRPEIDHTSGDAVSVAATGGDLVDVEIRHLSLAGSGNAIDVTSADPHAVGVTISDSHFADSGAEAIDVNPGSSGAFTATIENNTFSTASPTGDAIDLVTGSGAGDVQVAINDNTDITSAANAIHLDGTLGTGKLFVTGFANNTIHGNTGGAGVMATNVTFDADPSDTDFDEVAAGTWSVGSSIDSVGGVGVYLATIPQVVEGNLSFTQLDVFADGGGLDVAGAGIFTAGPPDSGFQLTIAAGTIVAGGGPAVTIDPATLGITLDSVSATNSPSTGISLTDVAGTFSATGGSLATTGVGSGPTFQVSGGSVNASYGGSVASAVGNSVRVQNMTGGTVTLNGPVDDDGAGVSITGNDAATSVTFNGGLALDTTTNTAFTATGDGSVTVASAPTNTISTSTGMGVLINGVDAVGSFDFDTVTVSNGGATGISIQSSGSTKTFGLVNVTNSGGAGLFASNAGSVNVTNAASTIATTGQPAVDADNTTLGATFASLSSNGSATTGIDLASVGGAFTATSVTIDDTTGAGVQLTGNSAAVALNGGTIGATTTTGGNAVDVNGGTGNVTIAAAITNTQNRSVSIQERSGGAVTLSGNIDDTGTGILVTNNNNGVANTVTFSGLSKVLNTGANTAVLLDNNDDAVVSFTGGGLDIDTSGAVTAFNAINGGTVQVSGAGNSVNTTSGTGTAVNFNATDIGPSDVTFQRIDVNGATSAVVLNNTGTAGGFKVTGADGPCGVVGSTDCDGGTIQNVTTGFSLTQTSNVSMQFMRFRDIGGEAVDGDRVTDGSGGSEDSLEVRSCEFLDVGTNSATDDVIDFAANMGAGTFNLLGTLTIADSLFDEDAVAANNAFEANGVLIRNDTGSLEVNVLNSRFRRNSGVASSAVNLSSFGDHAASVNYEDSEALDIRGEPLFATAQGPSASLDVNFHRNEVRSTGIHMAQPGITIGTANGGSLTFDITDNNPAGCASCGFFVPNVSIIVSNQNDDGQSQASVMEGRIQRNHIDQSDTGGGVFSDAIRVFGDANEQPDPATSPLRTVVLVEDNVVLDGDEGMEVSFRQVNAAASANEELHLTVRGNTFGTVANPITDIGIQGTEIFNGGPSAFILIENNDFHTVDEALDIRSRDTASVHLTIVANRDDDGDASDTGITSTTDDELEFDTADSASGCLDIRNNTLQGGAGSLELDEDAGTTFVVVQDAPDAAVDPNDIDDANGIPAGNVVVVGGVGFNAGGSCTIPTLPANS